MNRDEYIKRIKVIHANLFVMQNTDDPGFNSIVATLEAATRRCKIYPHSPYYTNLVDQTKSAVEMMRTIMKWHGIKSEKLSYIMGEIVKAHDAYATALKRRAEDVNNIDD